MEDVQNAKFIGWVATCASTCFFCSQVQPFLEVLKCKKNFELLPIAFVSTLYIDCFAWMIYGLRIANENIKMANIIGCSILTSLILIYLGFELKTYFVDSILNAIILVLSSLVIHKGLINVASESDTVALICLGFRAVTFVVPCVNIYQFIKEKNPALINHIPVILYIISCACWLCYGFKLDNNYIKLANCFGLLLGIVQIAMIAIYYIYKNKVPIDLNTSVTDIIAPSDEKKVEQSKTNFDEEKVERENEKPVKIITKIEN